MPLLVFSISARQEDALGAELNELLPQLAQRYQTSFVLPITLAAPAQTEAHATWDWVTLPAAASRQLQQRMLRTYAEWLRPSVSLFWGEATTPWLSHAGPHLGLRLQRADGRAPALVNVVQVAASRSSRAGADKRLAPELTRILDRELPLCLVLSPELGPDAVQGALTQRTGVREVRLYCTGTLTPHFKSLIETVATRHSGDVHLVLQLRQGLMDSPDRVADLRFLFAQRKRCRITVCGREGTLVSGGLSAAFHALRKLA